MTFILLREVISLKKMVVLHAKCSILISWSYSFIPLIILSILVKMPSTLITIISNSMEGQTPLVNLHNG